jgi:hypothetical protein
LNARDLYGIDAWRTNNSDEFSIDSWGVITNITALPVGVYGLQVWVNDTHNNLLSFSFSVTVEDTTSPTWIELPEDQTIEYGEGLWYDLNVTDLSGIQQWWLNDTVHFTINNDGVITNRTALVPGTYVITVIAHDPYSNIATVTLTITVLQATTKIPPPPLSMVFLAFAVVLGSVILLGVGAKLRRRRMSGLGPGIRVLFPS